MANNAGAPGNSGQPPQFKYSALLAPVDGLFDYIVEHSFRREEAGADALEALRKKTMEQARSAMCSPPDSVPLLQLMLRMVQARKVVEVGVFTGYTSLAMALALPNGGKLYACDITDEYAMTGIPFWDAAGVRDKIDLRIGPATETLDDLLKSEGEGSIDFGFIDANKDQYDAYYERLLRLLRPGGVIAVDNVLWSGRVLDPDAQDEDTRALQALNDKLVKDDRVHICMLPVSDGVTLVLKK